MTDHDGLSQIWNDLVHWISQDSNVSKNGAGFVHKGLQLRDCPNIGQPLSDNHLTRTTTTTTTTTHRGVYATRPIAKGELLIRLPIHRVLDGQSQDSMYPRPSSPEKNRTDFDQVTKVAVSAWLRCLAAYYRHCQCTEWRPYYQSLPDKYETLWQWTHQQQIDYLAGTSLLATVIESGPENNNNNNDDSTFHASKHGANKKQNELLEQRYWQQVRPYLVHCQLVPTTSMDRTTELQNFQQACQAISTRCFHLQAQAGQESEPSCTHHHHHHHPSAVNSNSYTGPFFLPVIDLVNHSNEQPSTTLRRDQSGNFVMTAERDIDANEEVVHSYGATLTASQCLQTFGFVPQETMQYAATRQGIKQDDATQSNYVPPSLTPAMLTNESIVKSCWKVIESDLPETLATIMHERHMEDESWTVRVDSKRRFDSLPDHLVVSGELSDDLVTLACLPFLPRCAYAEAIGSRLDQSILQDYYLGKLVGASLLLAIDSKLREYIPIPKSRDWEDLGDCTDDQELLQKLLQSNKNGKMAENASTTRQRMMYGLTVRLEEKACLERLRQKVMDLMEGLDDEVDDGLAMVGEEVTTKRQRTAK